MQNIRQQELTGSSPHPLKKLKRGSSTKIERIIAEMLINHHIPFTFRPIIFGREVDILVENRIVIECDGLHHKRLDRMKKDKVKENLLLRSGYTILRFPSRDIRLNRMKCFEMIYSALSLHFPNKYGNY